MKYQLLIFDFDGTVANSYPWLVNKLKVLAARHKLPEFTAVELDALRQEPLNQALKRARLPWWKLPQLVHEFRALMAQDIHQIELFAGLASLLPSLAEQGATLAVVSSNARENVQQVLGPALTARFTYFECGIGLFGKAAPLRKILQRSRCANTATIYIGDELRDAAAAREAQVAFGAVAWGYTHFAALAQSAPQETFANVAELAEKLLGDS